MFKVLRYTLYAIILVLGTEILNASTPTTSVESATLVTVNIKAKEEIRKVSAFHSIASSGSFEVIVSIGNSQNLRLEGDPKDIAKIETVVDNGVLRIQPKKGINFWNGNSSIDDVKIYVTARSLKGLYLSGSGEIDVKSIVKGNELKTIVSGSGTMEANVDVVNFSATVTGSGDLKVKGRAQNAKVVVSGSGEFDGGELRTESSSAKVTGSGEVSLQVSKALDAMTSGSGDIRYRGNASIKSSVTGSGKIVRF